MMMVRVVDVMVLLMLMVLLRVGALWVVVLRVVGVVAGDAGGEAPADINAAGVASDALVYGFAGDADGEGGVGGAPFCCAAGDDDCGGATCGGSWCGSARACGRFLGFVGRGLLLFLAGGLMGGVAGQVARQSCCPW